MNGPAKHLQLYSQSLEERLRAIVRRIPGAHDGFASHFIGIKDGNAAVIATRMEAARDPETGEWGLVQLTHVPALEETRRDIVSAPVLCFFDALYYCASFEAAELAAHDGRTVIETEEPMWRDTPHIRAAAEAAGQIIGADGMAVPCAHGAPLVAGSFNTQALRIAYRTKERDLGELKKPDLPAIANLVLGQALSAAPANQEIGAVPDVLLQGGVNRQRIAQQFKETWKRGNDVINYWEELQNSGHKSYYQQNPAGLLFVNFFTLGLRPAYARWKGHQNYNPERAFQALKKKFMANADALPDCAEKTLCLEFARSAEQGFYMECATAITESIRTEDKAPEKIAQGLPHIAKAAEAMGLDSGTASRLREEYLAGRLQRGAFFKKVQAFWGYSEADKELDGRYKLDKHGYIAYTRHPGLCDSLSEKGKKIGKGLEM